MFFLKTQLKQLSRSVRPSAEFRSQLWSRLSQNYGELYPQQACAHRFRFLAAALTSFVLLFSLGTGVYAYESPDVIDGHPLFFLKDGVEAVEGALAITPEARISYHTRMMTRRLDEGERVLTRNPNQVESALERAADELDLTVAEMIESIQDEQQRQRMIEILSVHHARLAELSARVQTNNEDNAITRLQSRIEHRGLSDVERDRLFDMRSRIQSIRQQRLENTLQTGQ